MEYLWIPILLILGLLVAAALRAGWLVGRRRLHVLGDGANDGLGAAEGAVFGMMGLLLAFTFTGAASRFDERRALIVEETNSIGTAWLRLDLLSEEPRARAQELFRQYVDLRLDVYTNVTDQERTAQAITAVGEQQMRIWQFLMEQVRGNPTQPLPVALLPPVNQMFDIATGRILATRQHPPLFIFVMLLMLVLVSAFFVGFSQSKVSRQSMVHMLGFALVTALALYLIIDLEYPRVGIIRVDSFDLALHELRESMN